MYSVNLTSNAGYSLPQAIQNDVISIFNAYGFTFSMSDDGKESGNISIVFDFPNIESALVGPDRLFNPSKGV